MINLPILPYAFDALLPIIDKETVEIHYSKHHQWYVNKINDLIVGTFYENMVLEEIIRTAENWAIFNNAAQIRNHNFYRNTLRPLQENNIPTEKLVEAIGKKRGSFEAFKQEFISKAANNFGSGRTWLVKDTSGNLDILNTSNANTPLKSSDITPLLTIDVREHAYYLKYQNRRQEYLTNIRSLINRDFADKNYTS